MRFGRFGYVFGAFLVVYVLANPTGRSFGKVFVFVEGAVVGGNLNNM